MPLYSTACPLPINRKIFRHRVSFSPTDLTGLSLWLKGDAGVTTSTVTPTYISQIVISGAGESTSNGTYVRSSGGNTTFYSGSNAIQGGGANWLLYDDSFGDATYENTNSLEQNSWTEYNATGAPSAVNTTSSGTPYTGVTAWADQSGNSRDGTADNGYPALISNALNGKPAIEFNGADARITGSEPTTSLPVTVIIVAKHLADTEIGMMYEQFADGDNMAFYRWTSGGQLRIYNGIDLTGETIVPFSFKIFGAIINETDSEIYINGSFDNSGDSGDFTPSGNYYLAHWAGGDTYTNMQIAEVVVYNRAITTPERQQVEGYLNDKYTIY